MMAFENTEPQDRSPSSFYDALSSGYDQMITFKESLEKAEASLKQIQSIISFSSVLDVACGTGRFTIAASLLGYTATGIDISEGMICKARENASNMNAEDVTLYVASMQQLHTVISHQYDLGLCLGNSLPHILDRDEMMQALRNCHDAISPGGLFVFQLLNYAAILERKESIVSEDVGSDGTHFKRYYDFLNDGLLRFNVEKTPKRQADKQEVSSTLLQPYTDSQLRALLNEADFHTIAFYADMAQTPFDRQESDILTVYAYT